MVVDFVTQKDFTGDRMRICTFSISSELLPTIGSTVILPDEQHRRPVLDICRKFGNYVDGVRHEIEVGDPIRAGSLSGFPGADNGTISVAEGVTEEQILKLVNR